MSLALLLALAAPPAFLGSGRFLQSPAVETVQLKPTGTMTIPIIERRPTAIHDVEDFFWVGENRLVFLRKGSQAEVVVTDGQGNAVRSIAVPPMPKDEKDPSSDQSGGDVNLAWCGGNRFVVFRSTAWQGAAWRLDAETGQVQRLSDFISPPIVDVAGAPDGTFAILGRLSTRVGLGDSVARFDAKGNLLWVRETGTRKVKEKDRWFSYAIAINPKGQIGLLSKSLRFFGHDGRSLPPVKLPDLLDNGMDLGFDAKGQPIVYHPGTYEPQLITLNASGQATKATALNDSGGKQIRLLNGFRSDSKGRFWASDGNAIYRLGANGIADKVIGNGPLNRGLSNVNYVYVSEEGAVYAMSADSGEIAAFETDGKPRFVARPLPEDFPERPHYAFFVVTRSNDLYVHGADGDGWLKFSPKGARLGYVPYYTGPEKPLKVPLKPDWHWYEHRAIDSKGRVMGVLNRWPDGSSLNGPTHIAATGDMLAVDYEVTRGTGPRRIAWFSSSGTPEGMAKLPPEVAEARCYGYDGRLAYFVTKDHVVALDRKALPAWRFPLPDSTSSWSVFTSREGLALYDGKKTVTWYALP